MIVGGSELDETVDEQLFEWAKNSKQVIFTGYTNVVEQFLSAMDTYILPSYREGFGMGVIEAEAMGVPVIVSNIPGPIDAMVNNQTGIIVNKKDVQSLEDAMIKLITEPDILKAYSANCVEHVVNNFEQKQLFKYILEDRKKLLDIE